MIIGKVDHNNCYLEFDYEPEKSSYLLGAMVAWESRHEDDEFADDNVKITGYDFHGQVAFQVNELGSYYNPELLIEFKTPWLFEYNVLRYSPQMIKRVDVIVQNRNQHGSVVAVLVCDQTPEKTIWEKESKAFINTEFGKKAQHATLLSQIYIECPTCNATGFRWSLSHWPNWVVVECDECLGHGQQVVNYYPFKKKREVANVHSVHQTGAFVPPGSDKAIISYDKWLRRSKQYMVERKFKRDSNDR